MGEVYRGRDSRIAREVAVKLLPEALAQDPDRLRRFEQEARAAGALNHPNILAIHDVGSTDGRSYIVFELLEGETLRDRLAPGPLPVRRAVDFALQICNGLAAAHHKGIVHRDLKPENLFLTRDGRVKILDFGLARQAESGASSTPLTQVPTSAPSTEPGIVMGTVGYMAPEQVRGKTADARSDVFALGAILYEMLTGRRAFRGSTAADTMSAILREEPADPSTSNAQVPPALDKIVAHCLGKESEERYHAARDVAFALETFSGLSVSSGPAPAVPSSRWTWIRTLAAALAGMAVLAAAEWIVGSRVAGSATPPTYKRLTYRRGFISGARFAPDGQTIVYSAGWDGAPLRIFVTRPEGREATPLQLPSASLLSVSSRGELAILLDSTVDAVSVFSRKGTLARVPLSGGSPRKVATDVRWADWSPDGESLAIVRQVGSGRRLEYPIGKTLLEAPLFVESPRVSRDGNRVAFLEGGFNSDFSIVAVDRSGRRSAAEHRVFDWYALSWSPKGDELWFPANVGGGGAETPIMAADLAGGLRVLERGPYNADLWDVSSDGKALLSRADLRQFNRGLLADWTNESDVAAGRFDLVPVDISADARTLVFRELFEPQGVWVGRSDGSPPVRLGDGFAHGLSPDGGWVLASQQGRLQGKLFALPTAVGEVKPISDGFFEGLYWATYFPDGKRVAVWGGSTAGGTGVFVVDSAGAKPRHVCPEGYGLWFGSSAVSPDGRLVAARSPEDRVALCPVEGGEPRPVPGLIGPYVSVRWSSDGRSLFVFRMGELPTRIQRVDVATGRATLWKELAPPEAAGVNVDWVVMTPDAAHYAYRGNQFLTVLYLVENLGSWEKPSFWSRLLGRAR